MDINSLSRQIQVGKPMNSPFKFNADKGFIIQGAGTNQRLLTVQIVAFAKDQDSKAAQGQFRSTYTLQFCA
uniref:Uncharacterized protein n=1 Tax=Sphaerodactylus townsendi TaxID=933632 RepID=A0ACB8FEP5_9SAUR